MDWPLALQLIITAIFGLVLGSFATALAHRAPLDISWFSLRKSPRSACPFCGHVLQCLDLVPLLSWLMQKGKCRHCAAAIPGSYPLIEISVAVLCVTAVAARGLFPLEISLPFLFAVPFLVALLVVDLRHKILPNALVLALALLGLGRFLVLCMGAGDWNWVGIVIDLLAGSAVYALMSWALSKIMSVVMRKKSMGMGDVKFFAVAGLWLGLGRLPDFMILSGVLGVLFGLFWLKVRRENMFPFGPALIVSFYVLSLI